MRRPVLTNKVLPICPSKRETICGDCVSGPLLREWWVSEHQREETMSVSKPKSKHNCLLGAVGFLYSGHRQDGECWTCPECGRVWVHACSEDAGCYWRERTGMKKRREARNGANV